MTIDLINISIIGRVGDTVALAAVSLGNIIVIMFVMSVMQGMNTALETLVSQAYGANEPKLCGQHLNRMRLILLILFIPVCLALTFSE
ncbi:MAG: MATE family efflux transporter [bacterium]